MNFQSYCYLFVFVFFKGGRKIVTHIIFSQDAKLQAFTCISEQKNTF